MKPEEIHFKWCTENGIRIYPVPISEANTGNYHIVVERNGKASKGKLIFKNEPTKDQPCVWQQIRTLYKMIYEKESIINQDTSARVVNAE